MRGKRQRVRRRGEEKDVNKEKREVDNDKINNRMQRNLRYKSWTEKRQANGTKKEEK